MFEAYVFPKFLFCFCFWSVESKKNAGSPAGLPKGESRGEGRASEGPVCLVLFYGVHLAVRGLWGCGAGVWSEAQAQAAGLKSWRKISRGGRRAVELWEVPLPASTRAHSRDGVRGLSTYGGWLGRIVDILAPRLPTIESHRVCRSRRLWRIFTACLTMYAIFFSIYTLVCWGGGRSDGLRFFFRSGYMCPAEGESASGGDGTKRVAYAVVFMSTIGCCETRAPSQRVKGVGGSQVGLEGVLLYWRGVFLYKWCCCIGPGSWVLCAPLALSATGGTERQHPAYAACLPLQPAISWSIRKNSIVC